MKHELIIDAERGEWFKWWEKVDDIVSGQKDRICTSKYIIPYRAEVANESRQKGIFENRLRFSPNKVESPGILTQHKTSLAQKIAITGFESPFAMDLLDNVDGWGNNAQNKFAERLWYYLKDGQVGTLVEAPEDVAETLLESQIRGERSYQVLYQAKDIIKLVYFKQGPRKGEIKDLYLRESDRIEGDKVYERVRRYYFRHSETGDGEMVTDEAYSVQILEREKRKNDLRYEQQERKLEYDLIEELQGSLSVIPFVVHGSGPKDSELRLIIDMDISLLNLYSMRRSINYNQCFRITAIFGVQDEEVINQIGEYMVHVFREEGRIQAIEPSSPDAIEREIVEFKSDIRDTAFRRQNSKLLDSTRQVQSAESRAKDLITLENVYNDILDYFEKREQMIYKLHAIFEGLNEDEVEVSTQRDFGLGDPEIMRTDEALIFNNASQLTGDVANEIKREVMKNQIDRLDISYEGKAELKQRVDSSEFNNPFTAPRQAQSTRIQERIRQQRQELLNNANGATA